MKKKHSSFLSSPFILTLFVLWIIIFGLAGIMGIIFTMISNSEHQVINAVVTTFPILVVIISFVIGSKMIHMVQIDNEKVSLKSIWGIHSLVLISDITRIHTVPFGRGDIFMICIEDGKERSLNMMKKNSLVRFQCSKKSVESLKQFCNQEIEFLPDKFQ